MPSRISDTTKNSQGHRIHLRRFDGPDKVMAENLEPDLLIQDDIGTKKKLPKRLSEYPAEVIMRRYESHSTMLTSVRSFVGRW